jgi:hypothetical protein
VVLYHPLEAKTPKRRTNAEGLAASEGQNHSGSGVPEEALICNNYLIIILLAEEQGGMMMNCRLAVYIERQLTVAAERPRDEHFFSHLYSCQQARCRALRLALGLMLVKRYHIGSAAPPARG